MRKPYEIWFNKMSTGYIGVIETRLGNRTLIQDYYTIEQIKQAFKSLGL
jgi:hypothetical protein